MLQLNLSGGGTTIRTKEQQKDHESQILAGKNQIPRELYQKTYGWQSFRSFHVTTVLQAYAGYTQPL